MRNTLVLALVANAVIAVAGNYLDALYVVVLVVVIIAAIIDDGVVALVIGMATTDDVSLAGFNGLAVVVRGVIAFGGPAGGSCEVVTMMSSFVFVKALCEQTREHETSDTRTSLLLLSRAFNEHNYVPTSCT